MESNGRIFAFRMPHLVMGCGARNELPALVGGLGRRVLVVSDPGVAAQPLFEQLLLSLIRSGLQVGVFKEVVAEPPVRIVEACVAAAREAGADVLLGIGGGSALDVAKIAAVLLKHECSIASLYGTNRVPCRGLPTVLVPTTAGTGSEVTPIAVLADEEQDLKIGIVSDYLLADHAVVDPQFCISLPPEPTAYTGMDALTHSIESYTNRIAVPLVDSIALDAMRLVAEHLRTAVSDGGNQPARYGMALASLLGGLCLKSVNCAAVHALAYPLGGRFHVPHGLANAVLLPHVLRFNQSAAEERFTRVAEALGGQNAVEQVERLSADIGTHRRLREFGVEQKHLPEMATSAMSVQRLLKNNPRSVSEADALAIYEQAW